MFRVGKMVLLTFTNHEVGHQKSHCVTRINVVSAIYMLAIDGQTHARQKLDHPLGNVDEREVIQLGSTLIMGICLGQDCDIHRYGTIKVVQAGQEENAAKHHSSVMKHASANLYLGQHSCQFFLPMLVNHHQRGSYECSHHDDDFRSIQAPRLVMDVI